MLQDLLRRAAIPLRVTAALAALYLLYIFASRHQANIRFMERDRPAEETKNRAFDEAYVGSDVKILQFYARDGVLTEGTSTVLCYGLLNAKSVKIEPPVEGVSVSLNRCVEIAPPKTTSYTLTAEGKDGKTVTASFTLTVQADAAALPKIDSFVIAKHTVENGHHFFLVTYSFHNANQVSIDPPAFSPLTDSAPWGQFYVSPEHTTTYTLKVTGKYGHTAEKKLTLAIPESAAQ
jgi:hypothetical protein